MDQQSQSTVSTQTELERLQKIEAGMIRLFARLDIRDQLGYFDQDMTTGELRGFFTDDVEVSGDSRAFTAKDGRQVKVWLEETTFGPKIMLEGVNCRLEGHIPGEYYLTSD